jgi:hypothetical protein
VTHEKAVKLFERDFLTGVEWMWPAFGSCFEWSTAMSWKIWLAGGVSLLVLVSVTCYARPQVVAFSRIGDVHTQLVEAGYYCTSDSSSGMVTDGVMISRQPSTREEAASLCKVGPMGPRWQGKVWITVTKPTWSIETIPDEAGVRTWGSIIAFGDPELLRDLDAVLAPKSRSFF